MKYFIDFIIFIIIGLFMGGFFNSPIDKKQMENEFIKNEELILTVTEYLVESEYEDIFISNSMKNGYMFVNADGGDVLIDNSAVVKAVAELKKCGFRYIDKHENTIAFERWVRFESSRGIAYSINGDEPTLQFLTELMPLQEPNWYYYEEDYNEWRVRYNKERQ